VLHRIALPVVSEWYQQRHSFFTILLARGTHAKYVQHLAGHASIQLTLDLYSHWMPSMGWNTADNMDEALS
jgi:site-specific recombinase XerD